MAIVAWRFQCDIPEGVTDPEVTVFVTSTYTNDATGEKVTPKTTDRMVLVKLSALPAFITSPTMPPPQKAIIQSSGVLNEPS